MSVQHKSTYLFIFTATVIFGVYGWWVFGVLGVEYFTGPDELVRIGRAIALLIIGGYAFEIATVLAAAIVSSKFPRNNKTDFTIDERDKQILYRSLSHSHHVLCIGLCLSIGALALGVSAFWVFNAMVLGYLLSIVAELSTKLFLYQRGF